MRINLGEDEQPEIGLIALIDCIFFLLMFFMVATSFKQQNMQKKVKELTVVLPTSSASLDRTDSGVAPLLIGVDKDGKFSMDGGVISVQALHDRLHLEAQADPNRTIRIDGDAHTPYQNIVHVLDLCQFEHLTNVALHTRN
jgi:biopolymer transport protein ExbD